MQYNREAPLIYNTIQCYLKDSHSRLLDELERARREVGLGSCRAEARACLGSRAARIASGCPS